MDNSHLLDALREGLPLTSRPFEAIGRACGASEDEVLERLRRLHGSGMLGDFGPLSAAGTGRPGEPAPGGFDERLLEVASTGFPLLSRPYEAIAAILGASEAEVLSHLRELIAAGLTGYIGARPRPGTGNEPHDAQNP